MPSLVSTMLQHHSLLTSAQLAQLGSTVLSAAADSLQSFSTHLSSTLFSSVMACSS